MGEFWSTRGIVSWLGSRDGEASKSVGSDMPG